MRAIALLSGGLDSVVSCYLARQEMELVLALTAHYGQRAAEREISAAGRVAAALGIPHQVLALPWVAAIADDALTTPTANLPTLEPEQLSGPAAVQSAAAVWVPNRNGLLINVAGVYADALGVEAIIAGFNAEEAATFADNSPAYVTAVNAALNFSTRAGVQVICPTGDMTKAEIVAAGRELGVPLHLIWSCYEGGNAPCQKCESCLRLQRAMSQ